MIRRAAIAGAIIVATQLLLAPPASADPAEPTDFRSVVTAQPAETVQVDIIGEDAFVRVTVTAGTAAEVLGYEGEPYLRFDENGAVEVNVNSPAHYLNADRFSNVSIPPFASVDAEPSWEEVASDGSYLFHDHRTHWMLPRDPADADFVDTDRNVVSNWSIDFVVAEAPTQAAGELVWLGEQNPLPWIVLLAVVAIAAALVTARWSGLAPWGLVVAAGVAVVVSVVEYASLPGDASPGPIALITAGIGLVLALAALVITKRETRTTLLFGSAALVAGWFLLRYDAFARATVPSDMPADLERSLTALSAGLALGVATGVLISTRRRSEPAIENAAAS